MSTFNSIFNLCILVVLFFDCVLANYCDFGLCDKGLYCCGENKCCKSVDVWYYWAAVLLIVISVIIVIYVFLRRRRNQDYLYTEVKQSEIS
ncbi:uncharacterized protein LOC109605780 [Aethina tumida]|uniref:uncharacterized protein LOC109605780 n=1 Tax=Aethina tumida TaxID=116153 RepID=UPI00214923B7|nr:uncharacterized protein LOC109605780 [Aethina tumida]